MVLTALGIKGTDAVFYHSTRRDRVVFVDEVPPGLICPTCADVFVEPLIAPCGHSTCAECVAKVNRQTGKCYSCAEPADPDDFMADNVRLVQIGDLRVFCRNALGLREVDDDARPVAAAGERAAGSSSMVPGVELFIRLDDFNETACAAAVRLRELDQHEETCMFRRLMCDLCDVVEEEEEDRQLRGPEGGTGTPAAGGVCGYTCLLRDMPHHRRTCAMRVVTCAYASFGCRWRGSFTRLAAHRASCRKQPRLCPNGCGAHVSVGPMMMTHLETCPTAEVTCDAPDAEEVGLDDAHAQRAVRCPAVVRRADLARHRREDCDWARAAPCRQCRVMVSLRSAGDHAAERCTRARQPCPSGCGRLIGKEDLERHLAEECVKTPVDCTYKPLGCTARTERGKMPGHLQHAAGQHLELVRQGLLEAQRRSEEHRAAVDEHKEAIVQGISSQRAEGMAALKAKESATLHDVSTMRERDAEVRARVAGDVEVLKQALADQSATYSAQLLDMFSDLKELRREFDAFRRRTEKEMTTLRATVEANKGKAESLFEEVSAQRSEAVGKYRAHVTQKLEDEERQWHMDVDKQTRALRAEFEDYKFGINAKLHELLDNLKYR